jgi:hypothetical protein
MGFSDIFKSREQRLFEKGIAKGLPYHEALSRAQGAVNSGMSKEVADVFVSTGNYCESARRAQGADTCGLRGIAKDVYLQTGDLQAAYRAQRMAESFQ